MSVVQLFEQIMPPYFQQPMDRSLTLTHELLAIVRASCNIILIRVQKGLSFRGHTNVR